MFFKSLAVAVAVGGAVAQRPSGTTICDYYTTALLKNNTAANQKTLLTLVVNTAVIGNYTQPNVGIKVPGILAPGMFNGTAVNLAPYFDGGFASTNGGGSAGIAQNFLDGGGAAPLMNNTAASDMTSNQYFLLTHLYEYFGVLLGCSMQGSADYPAYDGSPSMYELHKFMDISNAEISYFIEQVALAAASFGVAQSDLAIVGAALAGAFGMRCAPATTIIPSQGPQLQAMCIDASCPLSPNATCDAYGTAMRPVVANASLVPNMTASASGSASGTATGASKTASGSASATASGSGLPMVSNSAASVVGFSFAAVAGGLAALFL